MGEVTRQELNGLGGRVTATELQVATMKANVNRNTCDIQKIFDVAERIERTTNKSMWKILLMVCIPIVLFLLNIFITIGQKAPSA